MKVRGGSMSASYWLKDTNLQFPKNSKLIYEKLDLEISQDLPMTKENFDFVLQNNHQLTDLVSYLFNALIQSMPPDLIVLVFDSNGTLLKTFKKGNCDSFTNSFNLEEGRVWSCFCKENTVRTSLNQKKITLSDCDTKGNEKWSLATAPVNSHLPIGLISMAIPIKFYTLSVLNLFKLFTEFVTVLISNSQNLSDTQKYFEQMFGSLAHEVKNTLTTIRGFVQLLAKNEVNCDKLTYSNFILSELDRAHEILKNSIFYSSSKEQRVNLCKISDILHEVLGNLHGVIMNSNIVLDLSIDENLPYITGDRTQFRQVFLNIIQNSIEAMQNGGSLRIKCHLVNFEIHTTIEDTGIGIPANLISKVFQPFFSTKHGGTGLGLAVSKQVIEQYKGQIFIKSTKNIGTCFTIVLPI